MIVPSPLIFFVKGLGIDYWVVSFCVGVISSPCS